MKILKKAEQKNFLVDSAYYTSSQLQRMAACLLIFTINNDTDYRICSYDCKEVKVILNDYGYYTTVAVLHTGEYVYIKL